jgi:hypothetical protein
VPFCEQIAQIVVFALRRKHIEIFVYAEPPMASITMPALPVVQILIVQPIGLHTVHSTVVQLYHTVIVFVVVKLQDFADLAGWESCVFAHCDLSHSQYN